MSEEQVEATILRSVPVRNLDTNEIMPLSVALETLPKGVVHAKWIACSWPLSPLSNCQVMGGNSSDDHQ